MYVQALVGKEKALRVEYTSILSIVNNLGLLYSNLGKHIEVEVMYVRVLVGKEKALRVEHTSILDTVKNLGDLYCS
jgi:hypothetical protein